MDTDLNSEWVSVDGLKVHFKHGGQGPKVLLLHGGGNDWREWSLNIPDLLKSYEVYALDFPGFGQSEAPKEPIHPSWMISFMDEFTQAAGLSPAAFVGHSLGAMVAAAFALEMPDKVSKLVIIDGVGLGKVTRLGGLMTIFFHTVDALSGNKRGPTFIKGSNPILPIENHLDELKMPVLIVWGESDHYFPISHAEKAHAMIPQSKLCVLKGCRHAPQREAPEKFHAALSDFIQS